MHLSHVLVVLTTALTVTVSAAPLSRKADSLTNREELYPVQYLGVENRAEKGKRKELYPPEALGVKDDEQEWAEKGKRKELYPPKALGVKDDEQEWAEVEETYKL